VKIKSNEWEKTGKGGTAETRLNLHAIVHTWRAAQRSSPIGARGSCEPPIW
jgi:hypothetical protein